MRTPFTRSTLLGCALVALIPLAPGAAAAADYGYPSEVLRGTYAPVAAPAVDEVVQWHGGYLGAFAGYSQASYDFRRAFADTTAAAMNFTTYGGIGGMSAGTRTIGDAAIGGFVGYNYQVEEIVFGIEADYTHGGLQGRATDQRVVGTPLGCAAGFTCERYLTARASNELDGYGTLRARVGYTSGMFMPYVTGGLAVGQATFTRAVGVQDAGYRGPLAGTPAYRDPYGYASFDPATAHRTAFTAESVVKSKDIVVAGFAAGVGIDVAITQNIFVRGEYQYAFFDSFEGNKFHINTVRGALGVRW